MEKELAEVKTQLKNERDLCEAKNVQIKTLKELDAKRKTEMKEIKQNVHDLKAEVKSQLKKEKESCAAKDSQLKKQEEVNVQRKTEMEKVLTEVQSQLKAKNVQIKALKELAAQRKTEMEEIKQNVHDLQVEDARKNSRIQTLEKSANKVKNRLANRIYSYDEDNEDLNILLNLEISELFSRFEKNMKMDNDTSKMKLEEITGALSDMKNKLKLQTEKRDAYEEQHSEMMQILNIRRFANIIPAIKSLLERNETNLYSNAQVIIESSTRGKSMELMK